MKHFHSRSTFDIELMEDGPTPAPTDSGFAADGTHLARNGGRM